MSRTASTLFADLKVDVKVDAPLGVDTYLGVGGTADLLIRPHTVEALQLLMRRAHEQGIPFRIWGKGANLLVADEGVDGVVVKLDAEAFRHLRTNREGDVESTQVMAGRDLYKTVNELANRGLAGLEQTAGIPASIGGAVRMNAGGKYGAISDSIHSVACLDERGEQQIHRADSIDFSYRTSNLREPVILWASFLLQEENPRVLKQRVSDIWNYKKSTQPYSDSSAGCTFKNPIDPATGERVSAGMLVEQAGLKGTALGGAEVSRQHGNFLVAQHGATASDLLGLIALIQERVAEHAGIELSTEVVVWRRGGDDNE